MTDVLLYQTDNDGDVNLVAGDIETTNRFDTALYLSMFAGTGWWGDLCEEVPDRKMECKTGEALDTLPPSSNNVKRIQQAVLSDTAWFITAKVANSIDAAVTIPALNKVKISVTITASGKESQFEYTDNWTA